MSQEDHAPHGTHRNRLAEESSPYLLQHASNPVDWYPWGEEALARAKAEDMPILVSIGYSACHWCHVMERESFENEQTAELMNRRFVNIKIDREERPDLDRIYMAAVTTLTGSGGWPLNVFLTPDGKPFTGGTYFPPLDVQGRPSWTTVLERVDEIFRRERDRVEAQAAKLTAHIEESGQFFKADFDESVFSQPDYRPDLLKAVYEGMHKSRDNQHGGFGGAPKFPSSASLRFLMRYSAYSEDPDAREHALLSLDKMVRGGIYDQLGGGFARYTVDAAWMVPHFEKMLYDNALIAESLIEALQIEPGNKLREDGLIGTLDFILREMTDPAGGFYAALDADSEGVEGKFYTWSTAEIREVLSDDPDSAARIIAWYGMEEDGNWEGTNILHQHFEADAFADSNNLPEETWREERIRISQKLFEARAPRVRPGLDDKVLSGWNALMARTMIRSAQVLENEQYKERGLANLRFILDQMTSSDEQGDLLHRSWKNGQARFDAVLDDYAFLISALTEAYESTLDQNWLKEAIRWAEVVLKRFDTSNSPYFYFGASSAKDLVARQVELLDNETPSGNAIMAMVFNRLGRLADRPEWLERASSMLDQMGDSMKRFPTAFGAWATEMLDELTFRRELVTVGERATNYNSQLRRRFLPGVIFAGAEGPEQASDSGMSLLEWRGEAGKTLIYLCHDGACEMPVSSPDELMESQV